MVTGYRAATGLPPCPLPVTCNLSPVTYNVTMRNTAKFLSAGAFALFLAAGISSHDVRAQGPAQQSPSQPNPGAGNIVPAAADVPRERRSRHH